MESPVKGDFRLSRVPATIGDVEIPAGTTVMVLNAAANRDPRRFEDPATFDVDRENARHHVAFGRGIHTCPGAPLARAEARVSLERILDRTSDIRICGGAPRPRRCPPVPLRAHLHPPRADPAVPGVHAGSEGATPFRVASPCRPTSGTPSSTEERTCRVGTVGTDGPHVTALWFVWDGASVWLNSIVKSQRWMDLQKDPRVTVLVDTGEGFGELRGVEIRGRATAVGEVPRTGEAHADAGGAGAPLRRQVRRGRVQPRRPARLAPGRAREDRELGLPEDGCRNRPAVSRREREVRADPWPRHRR